MTRIDDVVIVGGGVCGCALARELAARDLRVTVVERDGVAAHASGKSWGGLYPASGAGIPGPLAGPAKRAFELHSALYGDLKDHSEIDYQLRPVESISLARDESDLAILKSEAIRIRESGFEAEILSAEHVRQLEPHVTSNIAGGMLQGYAAGTGLQRFHSRVGRVRTPHGGKISSRGTRSRSNRRTAASTVWSWIREK